MKIFKRWGAGMDLIQGSRFLKRAGKAKGDKAERFYLRAYQRFASALEKNPQMFEAYKNWGHGLYNSSINKSRKDQWRSYQSACEKYEKAYELEPNDFDTLKFWGLALRGKAQNQHEKNPGIVYREVYNKFSKAAQINHKNNDIFYHWGLTLYQEARKKNPKEAKKSYQQSCDKFSRANTITPDQPNTLNDWGAALMVLTNLSAERDKQSLLDEALGKFVAADAIEKGIASYNLACHYSLRGNIEECRKQLNIAQENWKLPALGYLENDSDFKNVRKLAWFKELIVKERTASAVTTK